MSEADHPHHQPFGEPTEPPPIPVSQDFDQSVNAPSSTADEEWTTVNFPNAIPIEQFLLNLETTIEPTTPVSSDLEVSPVEPAVVDAANWSEMATSPLTTAEEEIGEDNPLRVIQILHECNRDLINRVAELEAELDDSRQQSQGQQTEVLQRTQELVATQEQVKRLFKKLEIANQVIRQQQVLVETITQQWETTQTRLAQMERDCTLTQQRYNEQFHESVQLQNTCRELRSRLHRQQRQTLQFKAALERYLEMQQSQQAGQFNTITPSQSESSRHTKPLLLTSELFDTKAQPVQPWSKSLNEIPKRTDPLEELLKLEEDRITSEQNPGGGEKTPPTLESISSEATIPPVIQISSETTNSSSETEESELSQPRFLEDELDRIRLEYAAFISEDADLFLLQSSAQETTPEKPSSSVERPQPELAGVSGVRESSPSVNRESNWPAPLINPQRQKKLQSLASIKLPSFPTENPFVTEDF